MIDLLRISIGCLKFYKNRQLKIGIFGNTMRKICVAYDYNNMKVLLNVHRSTQLIGNCIQEVFSVQIHGFGDIWQSVDAASQIFGHQTSLDCVNACLFQCKSKSLQFGCIIQFGTVGQTSCPCKDWCNWIGGRWLSFLMLAVNAWPNKEEQIISNPLNSLYINNNENIIFHTDSVWWQFRVQLHFRLFCHRDKREPMPSYRVNRILEQQCRIEHRHHSFCTPKWISPKISNTEQPCHQSNDAHTKCSASRILIRTF